MPRQTSTPLPQLIFPRVIHLRKRIEQRLYESKGTLTVQVGPVHSNHVPLAQAQKETLEPIAPGDCFSPATLGVHKEFPWTHRWFKIEIPAATKETGATRLLHFVAHGEFTVYWNGEPWCGIDPCHPRSFLPNSQEAYTLWIDGGQWQTGFWFGLEPPDELGFRLLKCELEERDPAVFEVYHDLNMLIDWVEHQFREENIPRKTENGYYQPLDAVDPKLRRMLKRLNDACDVFDRDGIAGLSTILKSIYNDFPADPTAMSVSYVGHAHIDLVWLWPERVTYRKAIHTYSTMLRLMERYPEMTFTMSQPPLFYHIAEHEPRQASEIRHYIENGQWEFTGALEVEADTQIPVGEGLARSLIYGQERIQSVRGAPADTVWIPDVFGYSQCLPQLFSLAGIKNFYTTKILWSTITRFPHNSFVWKSPDGSEIMTHLAVSGYNCLIDIAESCEAQRSYRQADVHSELLCASGYGDGGGGPTEDHCERARRLKNLAGVPRAGWSTVEAFFERLNALRNELPMYRGELFLEYHRGVHSTQSDFKAMLRACERALQTREAFRVMNHAEALEPETWLRVLFEHFHDATPGSSINSVYKEMNAELRAVADDNIKAAREEWPSGDSALVVSNPVPWRRWCVVELPRECNSLVDPSGRSHAVQKNVEGKAIASVSLDGLSAEAFDMNKEAAENAPQPMDVTPRLLDNGVLRAEFSCDGSLVKMAIDGQELELEGSGTFMLHEDNPAAFDAWDMDHHVVWMKDALTDPLDLQVKAAGPVIAILEGRCNVGDQSKMTLRYILEAHSESLKVECIVDWQETNKTLRYEVQTAYRGELARFGAPFGSVDRSQTETGAKEEAQWEVPASRWASVLDGRNRGLSLVTEAKYGYRIKNGCIGVTLLRSPTYPDPVADKGHHRIRFALAPHRDECSGCGRGTSASKCDELFTPPIVLENARPSSSPITFTGLDSVVPSWVVPSRCDDGFLVRLHEVAGGQSMVCFSLSRTPKSVQVVDLNENVKEVLRSENRSYELTVSSYKIVTIKVIR